MSLIFSPHITSPKGGEIFNLGKVNIQWDINDPLTDDEYGTTSSISYEIEYTNKYNEDQTVWQIIKRRILSSEISFEWIVGKSIKSNSIRLRIRARDGLDGSVSDWSMISGDFSINVFKLIPPAIINPIENRIYTDFILIILDESTTKDTFNQKVRYTLEYSSIKTNVDWTVIVKDLPVGQNVIRWNIEDILPSDDYVLRLTAKNVSTSCSSTESNPDQIARKFVYNIKIQQPGVFIIDTKPPQAVLEIENNTGVTNSLIHTLNIFAEDTTTEIEQIQLRECDTKTQISLGNINSLNTGEDNCKTIEEILQETDINFNKLIGKPHSYSTKSQWTFDDKSGTRKLEALIKDSGGNSSLQDIRNVFIPAFNSAISINDFIVVQEQRDDITIQNVNGQVTITTVPGVFEVIYLVTSDGTYWILEPFPKIVNKTDKEPLKLFKFNSNIYIFTYSTITTIGSVLRDDKSTITNLFDFTSSLSKTNSVAIFNETMYIGLENGELWSYNGTSFSLVNTFDNPISALDGDSIYLYIGLFNSSMINLYNGSSFFESDLESS